MSESVDTEPQVVKTYVPGYQKADWEAEAEELEMSQSEFVRSMVQAGRRGFDLAGAESNGEEPPIEDATPGVEGMERRVQRVIADRGHADWDELLGTLTEDVEEELDEALNTLQDRNLIRYNGRHGGYQLIDHE